MQNSGVILRAEIGKQNAEAEAELAKDKAEVLKSEIKGIELMVSVYIMTL